MRRNNLGSNCATQVHTFAKPIVSALSALLLTTACMSTTPSMGGGSSGAVHVPFTSENKAMFSALIEVTEKEMNACKGERFAQTNKRNFNLNPHEDIAHKVVSLLNANPTLKGCNQKRMAEALFISPRTLQRKLKQSNTSFQQILDSERKSRLDDLLKQYSIADTADLLGFQEQSSFTHVFKKWFSTTPLKYQKQLISKE